MVALDDLILNQVLFEALHDHDGVDILEENV